ncbi:hypothetical protein MNBD_GAMMA18-1906 [hydrothermal vent metagenome]|uniref:Uncharacterized protein n=1 Tax=hydrothermal vent metagenome TaxID=652676 RepID=A0A3B0Z7A3_9ZZZZ
MLIIRAVIAIVALALYALAGRAILKMLNMPTTVRAMALFVVSGPAVALLSLVIQATVMAEEQGHLGDEPQLLTMLTVSLLISLLVSVVTVKVFGVKRS